MLHFCHISANRYISWEMTAWFQADEARWLKSHCSCDGSGPGPVPLANTFATWLDTPPHRRKSSSWVTLKTVLNMSLTCAYMAGDKRIIIDLIKGQVGTHKVPYALLIHLDFFLHFASASPGRHRSGSSWRLGRVSIHPMHPMQRIIPEIRQSWGRRFRLTLDLWFLCSAHVTMWNEGVYWKMDIRVDVHFLVSGVMSTPVFMITSALSSSSLTLLAIKLQFPTDSGCDTSSDLGGCELNFHAPVLGLGHSCGTETERFQVHHSLWQAQWLNIFSRLASVATPSPMFLTSPSMNGDAQKERNDFLECYLRLRRYINKKNCERAWEKLKQNGLRVTMSCLILNQYVLEYFY